MPYRRAVDEDALLDTLSINSILRHSVESKAAYFCFGRRASRMSAAGYFRRRHKPGDATPCSSPLFFILLLRAADWRIRAISCSPSK